jgi:hypothetical protein
VSDLLQVPRDVSIKVHFVLVLLPSTGFYGEETDF